ncbi:C45 family peptidase [Solidesulfovibrio sp.]|uniref:C45 family autoproteolytic acyltransferase/hydolase n=1 Tax=Solidesulfovibrio sp. TaxID=2910990 RepID=UPI00260BA53C|nr:C45 family peptidase [Solidesulfovibrio sp.]
MLRRRTKALVIGLSLLLAGWLGLAANPAGACTLFGLAGPEVAGGGTILVKNRDWRPNQTQELRLATPKGGYRYLGLFATGDAASGLKAGVNEAGLSAVTATAASIPREERKAERGMGGILRRLLTECGSVAEAVTRVDLFAQAKPCFFMLADRHEIARIETAPGGRFAVTHTARGALRQTNHYLEPSLADANKTVGASSRTRAGRIEQLLETVEKPAGLEAMLALSHDRASGPDDSVFRTGSRPASVHTMAVFAVAMPPEGTGTLSLRTLDPDAPERVQTVVLDAAAFAKR